MWKEFIHNTNRSPIMVLAPMADMTDSPYCRIVKKIGGVDVVFHEMVSSEAIVRDSKKTLKMIDFHEDERPIVQQVFGADPEIMAEAVRIVIEKTHPDGIDINMGCPVPKITGTDSGSSLMKDPVLAGEIVRAVKKVVGDIPLSVKTRLGWSDPDAYKTFLPMLEEAGVDLITLHGRTKTQGYSGEADWNRIAEAKKILTIPLIANGDVSRPELVSEMLSQTKADGVMIGRGALGNPWFFLQAKSGKNIPLEEKIPIILEHLQLHLERYGERGIVTFRKHLGWYFKTNRLEEEIPGIKEFRSRLVRVTSVLELEALLAEIVKK
ncbi:MAG: tRNA dihydrouridine synthase DusB [Candidatus Magasanikbacteria bacterium]